ncbi:MAG: protein kinase [Desulfatiglans sp.]|jgi:serine/threonine protein kinase|nr:protein kinase [Desulfatiglans sp.]
MPDLDDQQFGKYKLLNRVAEGGMAELYMAKLSGYEGFEKLVAIKKILPHLAEETNLIKAFIDEAKLAAFLQHPNIVQIYDFGSVHDTYYIAMEYLYGKDLKIVIKQYKEKGMMLSLENALYIATQVCAGIDYAHKLKDFQGKPLNIIHRDIGPHNVFITYDGQVKIIDFGIAKAATQVNKTQHGSIKGKITYMSPEQAKGEKIDHRSDIYAMGILLYEMVTHERMFDGEINYNLFKKVLESEYIPAQHLNRELPEDLCRIIDKALEKNPDMRYQSAEEMLTDIERCMLRLSIIPSYRDLTRFMNKLFDEGTADEAEETENSEQSSPTLKISDMPDLQSEKTLLLSDADLPYRKKQISKFTCYALSLIALIFILVVIIKRPEPLMNYFHFNASSESASGPASNSPNASDQEKVLSMGDSSGSGDLTQAYNTNADSLGLKEGIALLTAEKFTEAAALFEEILATEPHGGERISELYSHALVGQASGISANMPERAKALLLKAVKMNPGISQGHFLLGRIYTQQKDYTSAIASYQTAVDLDPQMSNAFFNMGYIYAIKNDYIKAHEMFARVVALSPPFLDEALYNLAIVQRKMGNIQDCIKNLEKAIAANPENNNAKKLLETLKK